MISHLISISLILRSYDDSSNPSIWFCLQNFLKKFLVIPGTFSNSDSVSKHP